MGFDFVLNGRPVHVESAVAQTTLLDFVRSRGLTGAKEGCAEGECGACTMLAVRPHGDGSAYVPFNSCLLFLPMAAGQEIYTVEALAPRNELTAVQRELAERGGSQCGYCTPGFVLSLFAEHYRPGRTGACDAHALSGNLCRCTGYRPIADAVKALGDPPSGEWLARLQAPAPPIERVQTDGFSRPESLTECLHLLAGMPDARLIAGGTDLAVESNLRQRRFPHLISVEALPELRGYRESENELELGAAMTLSELERLSGLPPVFQDWLPMFASPLIRNRATLGGNIATASPIGDAPPLLLALDAQVRIAGVNSHRIVPLAEFFSGYRQTALKPGELLVSVIIPKPFARNVGFYKAAKRRLDDISTVAACFALDTDRDGFVTRARVAFGGVAAVPLRALEAEQAMEGSRWNLAVVERAQEILRGRSGR